MAHSVEVLVRAVTLQDPGLKALAEIVHGVDLKGSKLDREETSGVVPDAPYQFFVRRKETRKRS